jgi:class 3 adenylate cyclase
VDIEDQVKALRAELELAPELALWADQLERSRWPGWLVDGDFVLRYASSELRVFMARSFGREPNDEAIGIGLPFLQALLTDAWAATMSPDSLAALLPRSMSYLKGEFGFTDEQARELVPEILWPFYEAAEVEPSYGMLSDRFMYTVPGLPDVPVEFIVFAIRGSDGRFMGAASVSQMGLRPTLVNLLSRGDERMYERMANLQEPRRCQGAILFADLEGSSKLSRTLSTSTYFSFIRSMATAMDAAIASNGGVVGKHAGDGASGFFLISENENPSEIAEGAMAAAREIRSAAKDVIEELCKGTSVDPAGLGINVGLHWGASLFVGQLVPGGRLDITALGDSVNECARIQEAARGGELLASKHFLEHLSGDAIVAAGLNLDTVTYRTIAEIEGVSEKAARDAGLIPVTRIS